jgi:peptide/nickel transport system substrate-binding protein
MSSGIRQARLRRRLVALALAGAAVLLAGLGGGLFRAMAGEAASPSPATPVTLRVGWVNEPDNLNPFIGYSTSSYLVYHLNYDQLTGYAAADVTPAPDLAESWTTSSDGLEWTFKLRQGVKWQDGEPFTSADVVFTFDYIIKNQLAAFTSYTTGITKVEAVDDYTVKFTTAKPKANMLGMVVPIVPEHLWSKISPKAAGTSYQNKPPIVGTGPFQVVDFKKGDFVRLAANKQYWRGAPKIDELIFQYYTNADSMVQDLKSGSIDACWGVPEAQFKPLGQEPALKTIDYVVKGFDELGYNCYAGPSLGNPVLKDWRFRQALNYAIDVQKLVSIAYSDYATSGSTIMVQGFYSDPDWHWTPPTAEAYTYDPAKATEMLAAAGYKTRPVPGGTPAVQLYDKQDQPITLRLFACEAPPQGQKIGKLLTGWLEAIGIDIKYSYMTEGAMNEYLYNEKDGVFTPNMDLFVYNWTGDVDPDFMLSLFTKAQIGDWSDCAWWTPEYDKLYVQQSETIDPSARKQLIDRMQQIVYAQSPYSVLAYPKGLEAVNTSEWEGWVQSPARTGSAIYSVDNIDSYLSVHPKTGAAAAAGSGGGPSSATVSVVVAITVIVIAAIALVLWRRGRRQVEE